MTIQKTTNKKCLTRRDLLRGAVGLIGLITLASCGNSMAPAPSPIFTAQMSNTPTAVKEINMVTAVERDTPLFDFANLVLTEAFQRNGIKFKLEAVPALRAIELVNTGVADGDAFRIYEFGETNPNYFRIEEPYYSLDLVGFAAKPDIQLDGWASLKEGRYQVGYRAGIKKMEDNLVGFIDEDKLIVVPGDATEGLKMLTAGRFDVFVTTPEAVALIQSGDFKDVYNAGVLDATPIYSYLHKKHANLAPRIAATIKEMKEEGLLERYREQQ